MSVKQNTVVFKRIVKTGFINFGRNAWLGIAAMAVMVITLTIILFSIIANATFANTIQQITDRIDVSVYLNDSVTNKQRDELINNLKGLENVESVTYISKDQALVIYKQQNAGNSDLLTAISQTDNPLPASLQIKPRDPNRIEEIRTYLEKGDIKALQSDETSYSGDRKQAIDKITSATNFFRQAGIAGIIIFAIISMLIIFNTIQMAIFNRRDELTIMRLLGASTNFIRGPFISVSSRTFEASSLGILDIDYSNTYFKDHFFAFLGLQLGVGVLIGAISSLIATRRYLKFKSSK